jgi:hypothetical protein
MGKDIEVKERKVYDSLNDLIDKGKTPDENETYVLLGEHKHHIYFLSDKTEIHGGVKAYVCNDDIKKYSFEDVISNQFDGGGWVDYDTYLTQIIEVSKKDHPISKGGSISKERNHNLLYHITPKGTEILNVKIDYDSQNRFGGYSFTIKETGFKSDTNYAWMIAEKTEENLKAISEYYEKYNELSDLKKLLISSGKKLKPCNR